MSATTTHYRRLPQATPFYSSDPGALERQVAGLLERREQPAPVTGVIAPHAGYTYSGRVAGAVFGAIVIPDTVVIMGPNHFGMGRSPAGIVTAGSWAMPLGDVPVNAELAKLILEECALVDDDPGTHSRDHAIEVELPFLQYLNPQVSIVPLSLMLRTYDDARELGLGLHRALRRFAGEVLLVASSDMSHFLPEDQTRQQDRLALEQIEAMSPQGLVDSVILHRITMCGYVPAAAVMTCALEMGPHEAELVHYTTSAEASGDYSRVVGYAGVLFKSV